jgi:hypothetical protein
MWQRGMLECQFLTCSLETVEDTNVCVQLLLGRDSKNMISCLDS